MIKKSSDFIHSITKNYRTMFAMVVTDGSLSNAHMTESLDAQVVPKIWEFELRYLRIVFQFLRNDPESSPW